MSGGQSAIRHPLRSIGLASTVGSLSGTPPLGTEKRSCNALPKPAARDSLCPSPWAIVLWEASDRPTRPAPANHHRLLDSHQPSPTEVPPCGGSGSRSLLLSALSSSRMPPPASGGEVRRRRDRRDGRRPVGPGESPSYLVVCERK